MQTQTNTNPHLQKILAFLKNILGNDFHKVKIDINSPKETKYYISFNVSIYINSHIKPSTIAKLEKYGFRFYKSTRKIVGKVTVCKDNGTLLFPSSNVKYYGRVVEVPTNNVSEKGKKLILSESEYEQLKELVQALKERIQLNPKSFEKAIGSKKYYNAIQNLIKLFENKIEKGEEQ